LLSFDVTLQKNITMTTIVINEKTKIGKLIMNMIIETNCGKVIDEKKPNRQTRAAINDSIAGKVHKVKSVTELMQKLAE
jgi:hypothetical protein